MSREVTDLSLRLRSLKHLYSKIRDHRCNRADFRVFSKRIMHLICEEGIATIDPQHIEIITPMKAAYEGEIISTADIVVVPIIRAGDAMLESFLSIVPDAIVGKILIQRDESTAKPILFYSKLPPLLQKKVIILDPMLATGGSAICCVNV